ncbi:hypothetical protein TNCV_4186611 [Trichonephila clavipes]|nr:hypothetical protein TNCV_4186611 [Trichonephila clavipes]
MRGTQPESKTAVGTLQEQDSSITPTRAESQRPLHENTPTAKPPTFSHRSRRLPAESTTSQLNPDMTYQVTITLSTLSSNLTSKLATS